jgi:hypothetical protein
MNAKKKYFCIFDSPSLEHKSSLYMVELLTHVWLWIIYGMMTLSNPAWFSVFIIDRFGVSIVVPASLSILLNVVFAIVSYLFPLLIANYSILKIYFVWFLFGLLAFADLLIGYVWNVNDEYGLNLFWLWCVILGVGWAVGYISAQTIIFVQQPKRDTGKIAGIKIVGRYAFGGLASAMFAIYWDSDNNSKNFEFGLTLAACQLLVIIIVLILIMIKIKVQ